jgi:hypothetical protein
MEDSELSGNKSSGSNFEEDAILIRFCHLRIF